MVTEITLYAIDHIAGEAGITFFYDSGSDTTTVLVNDGMCEYCLKIEDLERLVRILKTNQI